MGRLFAGWCVRRHRQRGAHDFDSFGIDDLRMREFQLEDPQLARILAPDNVLAVVQLRHRHCQLI